MAALPTEIRVVAPILGAVIHTTSEMGGFGSSVGLATC